MPAYEFWDKVSWPEHKDILSVIRLEKAQGWLVFKAFVEMDLGATGEVTVQQFHTYLGVPQTKFSERIFGILDLNGNGMLDFREFCVGVWNYCTYDVRLVTKLAFDIFDVDRKGRLDIYECDALLRMVYDVDDVNEIEGPPDGQQLLKDIDINGDGDVTIDEFSDLMETHQYILAPAFDLQRALRQRMLGVKYWEGETRVRKVIFAEDDALQYSSWESIAAILEKKKIELAESKEEAAALAKQARQDEDQEYMNRKTQLHRERQNRRKKKIEAIKKDTTKEEKDEQAAAADFMAAVSTFDRDFTFDELGEKVELRRELFNAFDKANTMAEIARTAREEYELRRAVNEDAEALVDEFLGTGDGQMRLKYEMALHFGKMRFTKFTDGNKFQAAIAPLYKSKEEETVTMVTSISLVFAQRGEIAPSREFARGKILEEFKEKRREEVEQTLKEKMAESKAKYQEAFDDLVGQFGGPKTVWEKLWDPSSQQHYWHNHESNTTKWEEPAICHNCDALIDPFDVRCFNCNQDRSKHNCTLYQGDSKLIRKADDEDEEGVAEWDGTSTTTGGGGASFASRAGTPASRAVTPAPR